MKKFFIVAFLLALIAPTVALAANPWEPFWGPILSCTGNYAASNGNQAVPDPTGPGAITTHCTSLCDLLVTGNNVIRFMLTIALFIAAPVMAAAGGVFILISGGSTERVHTGRQMLTGAGIGVLIILAAFPILNTFFAVFGSTTGIFSGGWSSISCNANAVNPGPIVYTCGNNNQPGTCATGQSCYRNDAVAGARYQCVNNCGGTVFGYCSTGNCVNNGPGQYSCQ